MLNELINELSAKYPEAKKLIAELLDNAEYLHYDVYDDEEALTAIHIVDDTMADLWETVENENFDNRNLSDKVFGKVIAEIKEITAEIDSIIDDYRQDAISKFDLFIA